MKKNGRKYGVMVIAAALPLLFATPASATQLVDNTNSIACNEVVLSAVQKIQYCGEVVLYDNVADAVADITVYKRASGQWIVDASVQVSVDQVVNHVDGVAKAGVAYPSGPQAGRAYGSTRGHTSIDRSVDHTAFATASFGVWKNGKEVKTFVNQQGPTTNIPAGDMAPGGGYTHSNGYGSLACTVKVVNADHAIRNCIAAGLSGGADTFAYKKVNGEWVEDASVQVGVDSVKNYIDGISTGGVAYPTGPQSGHATGGTRGIASPDPSVPHAVYATATVGIWQNGQEVSMNTLMSNQGIIPAQS
jgi:hypothetical protein